MAGRVLFIVAVHCSPAPQAAPRVDASETPRWPALMGHRMTHRLVPVGTFWAHLGTNQGNLSESHRMLFRRSQPFWLSDLGHAEGSNPPATATVLDLFAQFRSLFYPAVDVCSEPLPTFCPHSAAE